MTTQKMPGADAARHGTGDADLTIMIAAHDAFRRDLTRLARAAAAANLSDPAKRRSVAAGWEVFKRQLHMHHTAEDEIIWPAMRPRLAHSQTALSVLDALEAEHERIDPLLAAVDAAFARHGGATGGTPGVAVSGATGGTPGVAVSGANGGSPGVAVSGATGGTPAVAVSGATGGMPAVAVSGAADDWPGEDRLADVIDVLASTLTGHLAHEEREGLPLIGVALTGAEWRGAGRKIARKNGLSSGGEMFAWILDGADREHAAATLGQLPPPLRLLYRAVWKPRFDKTPRW